MVQEGYTAALLGPRLSLTEWGALPEDVPGEFLNGRLVEEEMPDYLHEVLVAWLIRVLGNWADGKGISVAGSDARFAVSTEHGRKPDVTVFFAGRKPPARGVIGIPPNIAVEVISSLPRDEQRDREEKRKEYAEFGIESYWIVDPQRRRVDFLVLNNSRDYAVAFSASGGVVAPPSCEGLEIDLDAMWAKMDELL